jgi:hypothetical protein
MKPSSPTLLKYVEIKNKFFLFSRLMLLFLNKTNKTRMGWRGKGDGAILVALVHEAKAQDKRILLVTYLGRQDSGQTARESQLWAQY